MRQKVVNACQRDSERKADKCPDPTKTHAVQLGEPDWFLNFNYQYKGSLNGRNASRILRRSSVVTEESLSTRAFAIAFSRGLSNFQVDGARGSQKNAKSAKETVPAPIKYVDERLCI